MHPLLRALLFGAACASFGFGLALVTLPTQRRLSSPPPSAVTSSVTPPLSEPTLSAPAAAPTPLSPQPRADSTVPPPAASSVQAEPPAAAGAAVARRLVPVRAPTSAAEAEREPLRSRSLLSGFRLLGPGESGGVRLARVAPGSLPAALGLKSYDEIISINGYRLSDPEQALLAYARLRSAERLDLKLARGGAPTEIVYFIR